METGKRKEWIDVIRAIGVLFIIFGHYYRKSNTYFVFTSPIKVPLLFAISGYVFSTRSGDVGRFFKNLLLKLIIPWIVLTWVPELLGCLVGLTNKKVGEVLYIALSGRNMWYFPCLIIAETIFFFVLKFCKRIEYVIGVSVLITVGGYLLSVNDILSFAMINRAMVVQAFLALGYVLKNKWPKLKTGYICALFAFYLGLCVLSLIIYPGLTMDVHSNVYYSIPLCTILIGIGCVSVFLIAERIGKAPRLLVFLGQNTLILWTMNGYFLFVLNVVLRRLSIVLPDNLLIAIIKVVYVCIGCGLLSVFVNKYLPEIVGKKRKTEKSMELIENSSRINRLEP